MGKSRCNMQNVKQVLWGHQPVSLISSGMSLGIRLYRKGKGAQRRPQLRGEGGGGSYAFSSPPTFSKPFLTLALLASGDPLVASVTWSRAAAWTVVCKQGQQTVSPEGQGPGPSSWGGGEGPLVQVHASGGRGSLRTAFRPADSRPGPAGLPPEPQP